jgi:hypothetical protein
VPQLEVWEKVQVSDAFLASLHGRSECTVCHAGAGSATDKTQAHLGMVADPSDGDATACADCHGGIVSDHAASIHGTQQGFFTSISRRTGLTAASPALASMFGANCAKCHTSCGQCHISRPVSVEGGLVWEHEVHRSPNPVKNCMGCHGSRVADEFRGVNEGCDADVHYLHLMNCLDCHEADEIHGDGTTPDNRYDVSDSPTCLDADCHADVGKSPNPQNAYHTAFHLANVACQVCHADRYKNCYRCHVGEGLQVPSQIDFRIGRNPIQDSRRPWEYVVLRHIPIAPDSYSGYGIATPNYSDYPTWKYATPHSIQRNTPQTASCEACHENPNLFLTRAYVDSLVAEGTMAHEEIAANEAVMVDAPPKWTGAPVSGHK